MHRWTPPVQYPLELHDTAADGSYIGAPMYSRVIHRRAGHTSEDGSYIGAPMFEYAFLQTGTIKRSPNTLIGKIDSIENAAGTVKI